MTDTPADRLATNPKNPHHDAAMLWSPKRIEDNLMARETVFVVQAYIAGRGNGLKADHPIPCKSADAARRMAERLALTKLGVIALSTSGDQELGDYDDEPTLLFKAGRLPAQFEDMNANP